MTNNDVVPTFKKLIKEHMLNGVKSYDQLSLPEQDSLLAAALNGYTVSEWNWLCSDRLTTAIQDWLLGRETAYVVAEAVRFEMESAFKSFIDEYITWHRELHEQDLKEEAGLKPRVDDINGEIKWRK